MRTVIVEDEMAHRSELRHLLERYCPTVQIVGEAGSADEGLSVIAAQQPDLVFLDIQMPNKTGFDMLVALPGHDFAVVFTTGFNQYGIDAVKANALDYLLKPLDAAELIEAVWKASRKQAKEDQAKQIANMLVNFQEQEKANHRISIQLINEVRFINPAEILYCEANNNYTKFFLKDGKELIASKGLYEFEGILQPYGFLRCHQSYIVNRKYVLAMLRQHNIHELQLLGKVRIPLSRLKKDEIMDALRKKK